MALRWSWAFGSENATTLTNSAAFGMPASYAATSAAGETYTYAGSPTRWAGKVTSTAGFFTLPSAPFTTQTQGWIAAPIKILSPTLPFVTANAVLQVNTALGVSAVEARMVSATGALALYVNNTFKANTPPYDWSDWHYVALGFNVGTATFSGELWIDGPVVATVSGSQAASAQTAVTFRCGPPTANTIWGQFAVWDALLADTAVASKPLYVTRAEPITQNATTNPAPPAGWNPVGAATNPLALQSPIDTATYSQEATPVSGEQVACNSNTISTALGATPPAVYGMTLHTYSAGQAISARGRISDDNGVTWDSGANTLIDGVNTTYAFVTSIDKPSSGGANTPWSGADTITMAYAVV